MKIYNMVRKEDVNGISGTGIVAEVCEFSDGTCVVRWIKEATLQNVGSTVVYNNQEDLLKVHGHGGKTYLDEICEYRTDRSGRAYVNVNDSVYCFNGYNCENADALDYCRVCERYVNARA